jgi:HSP20 family protein
MRRSLVSRQLEPFDALMQLQNQLEQVFERPLGWFSTATAGRGSFPPANIFRGADGYVVRLELPGVSAEEVSVETQLNSIRVTGKRGASEALGAPHRLERWSGAFSRSIELPADADLGQPNAEYRNGVLSISVPLREEAKPRKIEIRQNSRPQ